MSDSSTQSLNIYAFAYAAQQIFNDEFDHITRNTHSSNCFGEYVESVGKWLLDTIITSLFALERNCVFQGLQVYLTRPESAAKRARRRSSY